MDNGDIIPRLIQIDGANFMHTFAKVNHGYSNLYETRQNAFHLIPLVNYFASRGYSVRVIVEDHAFKPHLTQRVDALKFLKELGIAYIPEKVREKESDDLAMLKCAENYGAIILSGDKFFNHPQYKLVRNRYVISYKRDAKEMDPDHTNVAAIDCRYVFDAKGKKFYASRFDDDYQKVEQSQRNFPPLNPSQLRRLNLFALYLHCDLCSKFGVPMPAMASFITKDYHFPVNFRQFEKLANQAQHF